jgi:hypothetical protein
MKSFKVVSPPELLGIRAAMDEDELIQILGGDAVHMAPRGYRMLAENFVKLVESEKSAFAGGKRGREQDQDEDEDEAGIVNFHRRRHEWLYNVVSGAGGWKPSPIVKMTGYRREKGGTMGTSAAQSGSAGYGSGAGKGPFGQSGGQMGGNS